MGAALPGDQNAFSPALTKGGKLATLLMNGLQGALAGRAASEQAVIQSGGRRSAGVGTGFQAGFTLPWQRAMLPLEYQQKQAETQLAQEGLKPVDVGGVSVPQAVAPKFLSPYLGYQGKIGAAQIGGQARVEGAELGKEGRVEAAKINQGVPIPVDETVANLAGYPELAGQKVGKGTWSSLSKSISAQGYQFKDLGNEGLWLVDRAGHKIKRMSDSPLLQRALAGSIEVADVNNPGETKIESKGQAIATGAPGAQSASVQVPRQAAKAEVPTNIGNQRVAFQTMIDHSKLLRQAAHALQNGDVRLLNSISNRAMSEFGDPALTDFNAISNAYNHEVTSVISKGHMTDSEVKTGGATMPSDANFATIDKVLQSYESLANSKMQQMDKQITRAKGNVNRQPASSGSAVGDLLKKHGF